MLGVGGTTKSIWLWRHFGEKHWASIVNMNMQFTAAETSFTLMSLNCCNVEQDGNVPSRRHILGSKIFKEQLLEKFGKKFFSKKNFLIFFSKKSIF